VQDLEATNSSAQARLDDVSLEIDTLLEGDSAAPANGKYLNFVAHMYVADLTTSDTLPCASYPNGVIVIVRNEHRNQNPCRHYRINRRLPFRQHRSLPLVVAKPIAYPGVPSLVKVGFLDRRL
jgi:hypothetical protein